MKRAFGALRAEVEAARVPADLFARIAHRAEERKGGARGRWRVVLAASAAAVVLLGAGGLAFWWRSRPPELAGFQVASASPDFRPQVSGDLLTVESGKAWVQVKGLGARISLSGSTRLRRERRGVRLLRGTAAFQVEPRHEAPFAVYVSGGRIEVLGTRFTVVQGDDAGEVSLADGSIRFVDSRGHETLLHPGQQLRWPPAPVDDALPPATAPEKAPSPSPARETPRRHSPAGDRASSAGLAPTEPPSSPAPAEAAARQRRVLAEIDGLRIRREDERLVRRLDEILAEGVPEPLRERLGFERCDVLAHKAGGERRACVEIERQLMAYPRSEYTPRLQQSRRSLGCKP
jgi:hypothetical protein